MFKPASHFPDIIWPDIYPPHGSSMLALQFQFEQSQWWSPEQIRQQQLRQLAVVFQHARTTVPFYKQKYKALSISKAEILNDEMWSTVPTLSREEIQMAGAQMMSNNMPKQHGQMKDVSTSGSTGRTVKLKATNITSMFWHANTLRDHLWHKRDFSKSLAVIRLLGKEHGTKTLTAKNWGPATEMVTQTGLSYALDIRNSIQEQIKFLQATKPDYLLTYPSNALALAQYIKQYNLPVPHLSELRMFGEMLPDSTRLFCQQVFQTRVTDLYSCQEAGYIALQCPDHNHYHVLSESLLVEVLNEHNEPCLPGEVGRVLISSLHNFATPLIRYELGDYAQVGAPCSCGRGHLVLEKILGRTRNMLTYPDGRKNWPVFGSDQFDDIVPVKQFQFIQKSDQDLIMKLVVDKPLTESIEKRLRTHILKSLGYEFNLQFQYQAHIERSAGGKFEDFISELG